MKFSMNRNNGKMLPKLIVLVGSLICVGQVTADPFTLTGQVNPANVGAYSIDALKDPSRYTSVTETVNGVSYKGVPLWSFLGGDPANTTTNVSGLVIPSGGGNNPILRSYIVATGASGQSLVSLGEILPFFGGAGQPTALEQPYLLAYQRNGLDLAAPTLVVASDPTGTRNVERLANLSVLGVPRPPVGAGGATIQFSLSGVDNPGNYNLATLQAFSPPPETVTTAFLSGASTTYIDHTYTGVSLWDLLTGAGFHGDILNDYVLVRGSDGFEVLYSLAELDPARGAPNVLVGYAVDGGSLGAGGFARIVFPGDVHGGRYVSNIAAIELVAVPEPPVFALFSLGLIGAFVSRWKRHFATHA